MKTPRGERPTFWGETCDSDEGRFKRKDAAMHQQLITLVGAVALLGASGAMAQGFGPGEGGHGRGGFHGPGRFLDLTEDQQAAAREIFEQQRPQRQALHEEMRANRAALHESLEGDYPDPTLVGEIVIEGHALKKRSRGLRTESMKALESILSDEQKLKLEMLEAARGSKGRRGMSGPGGLMGRPGGAWGPPGRGPVPE